jgi:predicted dienelactone hydrolase
LLGWHFKEFCTMSSSAKTPSTRFAGGLRWLANRAVVSLAVVASMAFTAQVALAQTVVGTSTLDFKDKARSRNLTTEIWFSAAAGSKPQGFSPLLPIGTIEIARNAQPDPAFVKRPLIVVSHGNWGTRFSQGWLARQLVLAGYVVITPSHPGTMNDNRNMAGAIRLWERSQDVRVVLDQVLADPQWAPLIDAQRIGFWGHSFGGWTGVSLAGGRFDVQQMMAQCAQQQPKDMYCEGALTDEAKAVPTTGSADDFHDPRIKAFYLAASGPGVGMSSESLQAIKMPMAFDTAKLDTVLAPNENAHYLAKTIPGATEVTRDVGHFSYVPMCKPIVGKLAAALICTDPDGVDRQALHNSVQTDAVAFFGRHLVAKPQTEATR